VCPDPAGTSMTEPRSVVISEGPAGLSPAAVTVFLCVNCARPGRLPTSAGRPRPEVPDFRWPASVRPVLLPCTGRLQPEQVLKAFESGADLVCAVGCQEDNCHYLEGSRRCARRVDHVRSILREIGLGSERLMFFTLPGTAAEDLALGAGRPAPQAGPALAPLIAAVRSQVAAAIENLPPSALRQPSAKEETGDPLQEEDLSDDNED
jgi:coenzyme F420-reducing hydrogenase delta subunit